MNFTVPAASVFSFEDYIGSRPIFLIYGVCIYLGAIFAFCKLMLKRPPLSCRSILVFHNYFLSISSGVIGVGIIYEVSVLYKKGNYLIDIMCNRSDGIMNGRLGVWMYVFYISKYYEFLDTIVMKLRNKRLIFLHVYHQCIVVPMSYTLLRTGAAQW